MHRACRLTPILCLIALSLPMISLGGEPAMQLVMLGTGTPNADPVRSGPAVAVVVGGKAFIVDAGPGVVRRAAAVADKGVAALEPHNLKHVFLTHLHSDHTLGLPDLMFTPWVLERSQALYLVGPQGSRSMVDHLTAAYSADIDIRLNGLEPANSEGYKVDVHEIDADYLVYTSTDITIEAIPVLHGNWKQAFAYQFSAHGKKIVISGDARPSPALVKAAVDADILVHEVYSDAGFKRRDPVWQKYHASFHTSASELAAIATETRPKLLILYHQLFWGTSDEDLVKEIKAAGYAGPVVSATDLDVFTP